MNAKVTPLADARAEEYDWGRIAWMVSAALGNSQTMTFGKVVIKAGCANPRHFHPNCDEVLHLLSGRLDHSVAGERVVMNPGDTISIPQGIAHNAAALGDQDAVAIISFSSAHREAQGE